METVLYSIPFGEFTDLLRKCIREEITLIKSDNQPEELLRIDQVTKLFKVSKVTLYKWRKKGILPFHRVGTIVYFKMSDLEAILNHQPNRKKLKHGK